MVLVEVYSLPGSMSLSRSLYLSISLSISLFGCVLRWASLIVGDTNMISNDDVIISVNDGDDININNDNCFGIIIYFNEDRLMIIPLVELALITQFSIIWQN